MKRSVLAAATAGALFATLGVSAAWAAPLPFTWMPSGSTPPLSSAGGTFTADNFSLNDFAHIHIVSSGAFTQQGLLQIGSFRFGASTVSTPGLNGAPGATPYQIYFSFSGSGSISGWSSCMGTGVCSGSFSTLTYNLWGDIGGNATFGFSGLIPTVTPGIYPPILLASGSLLSGCGVDCLNPVTLSFPHPGSVAPSAFASATFNPNVLQAGFFVAPLITLDLQNSLFDSTGVSTLSSCGADCSDITINEGGGNGTFFTVAVPEPGSLLLFGTVLVIWVGASRRRRDALQADGSARQQIP